MMPPTVTTLPEIRTQDGRILLPASPLVPRHTLPPLPDGGPTYVEVRKRLVAEGRITSADNEADELVTPRVGGVYEPETWQERGVHWHGCLTQANPDAPKMERTRRPWSGTVLGAQPGDAPSSGGWQAWQRSVSAVLWSPIEVLLWVDHQLRTYIEQVPPIYMEKGEYDRHLHGDGLARETESYLCSLSRGGTVARSLRLEATVLMEVWALPVTSNRDQAEASVGLRYCTTHLPQGDTTR